MITKELQDLNLNQIAYSGQCFLWTELSPEKYLIQTGMKAVIVSQRDGKTVFSCSDEEFELTWKDYFDLDTDYGVYRQFIDDKDTFMKQAFEFGSGVRILRQDLWETMVSFLISQNNNISRIRNSMNAISKKYGRAFQIESVTEAGGIHLCSFPRPDELAGATEEQFRELGLGYRAGYLIELVNAMKDGGLRRFEDETGSAEEEAVVTRLKALRGIGPKVADCIALFGLHRINRFPVDTHMKQILARHYPDGFPMERYNGFLGVIQQYMFYYDLRNK